MATRDDTEKALRDAIRAHQQGDLVTAEALYTQILDKVPAHHSTLNLRGLARFQHTGREAAMADLERAAALAPRVSKYRYDLGVVEQTAGSATVAARHYEAAVALDPKLGAAWENLGVARFDAGENDAAITAFENALALNPGSLLALANLATLRRWQGDNAAALVLLERGLAIDPLDASLRMKRAEALLSTGDCARGWHEYAWRFVHGEQWGARPTSLVPLRRWSGEPLTGRHVLVHPEQGIGDEVMFAGYLDELRSRAARVTLICDPRLAPAIARSLPWLEVVPNTAGDWLTAGESVAADLRIPLGDLPAAFMPATDIEPRDGWLRADPALRAHWRERLDAHGGRLRIGLSWRGGATERTRQARSVALAALDALFSATDASFINLQYGDCDAEIAAAPAAVRKGLLRFPEIEPLRDLDGLFALIAELDLVITVDNSTVHFAGALGVPTWMLTPALADWRWPAQGSASRWYRSVRLFRQDRAARDWSATIASMVGELRTLDLRSREPIVPVAANRKVFAGMPRASGPRALLLNDTTHWYHWGCACTSLGLRGALTARRRQVHSIGIAALGNLQPLPSSAAQLSDATLFDAFRRAQANLCDAIAAADEVWINGEGTLHGATVAAIGLLYVAWIARTRFDKPVRIVNHSCYPTDSATATGGPVEDFYRAVYRCLDSVAIREPVSAALMRSLGIAVTDSFDCLPLFADSVADVICHDPGDDLLIAGSVAHGDASVTACAELCREARAAGLRPRLLVGANANLAADDRQFARALWRAASGNVELLHAGSEVEWLSAIASARALVSGRFHYSIAAAWLGTPFIALGSNTPKMTGLMQALGLPGQGVDATGSGLPGQVRALLAYPTGARVTDETRRRLREAAQRNFA